jgi:hypothetical protein
MTGQHERLLRMVEKRGGVPRRSKKTGFLETVQCAWNKAPPKGEPPYETWMGLMMAYRRLRAALKRRHGEDRMLSGKTINRRE